MAKKKWWASLLGLTSAICLGVGATTLQSNVESVNADEPVGKNVVVTGFDSGSVKFYNSNNDNTIGEAGAAVTLENVTAGSAVDNAGSPWVRYNDPTDLNKWDSHNTDTLSYPDAFTFETNIDGANDGNALAMNNLENYTTAGSFAIKFAEPISAGDITALNVRFLSHTGDGNNRFRIFNYEGAEQVAEMKTSTTEDTWTTITITGNDLALLFNDSDEIEGISILVHWSTGGIYDGDMDHRCYMLLDEVTYTAGYGTISDFDDSAQVKFYNNHTDTTVGEANAPIVFENAPTGCPIDGAGSPWVRYNDPADLNRWTGLNSDTATYPTAFSFETGVAGAKDGKALAINIVKGYTVGTSFKMSFPSIDLSEVAGIKIRFFAHTGDSSLRFRVWNAAGNVEGGEYASLVEDTWSTLSISGADLTAIAGENNTLSGLGFLLQWGSTESTYAGDMENRSYFMIDEITFSYVTESYNVTYDYAGKLNNTTEIVNVFPFKASKPADPVVNGYDFAGWYADAEYTTEYDFDAKLTADTTIYAKFEEIEFAKGLITDMRNNTVSLGTADIERESYTEYAGFAVGWGSDWPEYGTEWKTDVEGSEDGNALQLNVVGANLTSAVGFGLTFANPLTVAEVGSITLRVYMHIDKAGDSVFRVYADNEEHFDFTTEVQDEWVDIVITKADLNRIVTGETLSKLSFILTYGSIYTGAYKEVYSAYWDTTFACEPAWFWLDTITYADVAKVTFVDGETTTVVDGAKGSPVEAPAVNPPAGKVFMGWYNGETLFDINSPISGEMTLTAKYGDEITDYSAVAGVYAYEDFRVILNADKTMFIVTPYGTTECTYAGASTGAMVATYEGEAAYFTCKDGKVDLDGVELTKGTAVKVTYKLLSETREILCLSGDIALNLTYVELGYEMKGWYVDGATEAYAFDTAITADLTLTAKLEKVEIEDYTEYLGTYYDAESGAMLVLAAENKATVVLSGESKEASYWLLTDGVGVYAIDGVETAFEYVAAKVILNGAELKVLKNYSVAFKADGATLSVIYVNSGLYNATKPEDPVKEGYNFVGWFEAGATEAFDFNSVITKNTVLTAKFEKKGVDKKESGCGSSISGLAIAGVTLIGAAAFVLRKKED